MSKMPRARDTDTAGTVKNCDDLPPITSPNLDSRDRKKSGEGLNSSFGESNLATYGRLYPDALATSAGDNRKRRTRAFSRMTFGLSFASSLVRRPPERR